MVGRDRRVTITTTGINCDNCGTRTVGSYHRDGQCDGVIIQVEESWQCAGCGVQIRRSGTCPECGANATENAVTVGVNFRPDIAASAVEQALSAKFAEQTGFDMTNDTELQALARAHSHRTLEQRVFGQESKVPDLAAGIESLRHPINAFRSREVGINPDSRTVDGIATELVTECGSDVLSGVDFPLTHSGIGVAFAPRGSIYATVVFAKRGAIDLDLAEVEQAIHTAVNNQRRNNGLESLSFDHHLASIAREHSRHMAQDGFFAHETPAGDDFSDRYQRANYKSHSGAENISKRYPPDNATPTDVAKNVVSGWMESSGHRKNILEQRWKTEGIGVYRSTDGAYLVTQNFS